MAGSFKHVTNDKGKLLSPEEMSNNVENGGDLYETVEEMYGMIWWLASFLSGDIKTSVEKGVKNYKIGLKIAEEELNK